LIQHPGLFNRHGKSEVIREVLGPDFHHRNVGYIHQHQGKRGQEHQEHNRHVEDIAVFFLPETLPKGHG
jgi:hypothetical protein